MASTGTRRDYGSGSVYRRKDGRWVGAISAGWTERGTRRRVSVTAPTKAEAKRLLRKKIQALEEGVAAETSGRVTVKTWADQWLPMAERTLAPHSMTATRSAVRKWVVPTIGHRRFDQLSPADVRAVLDAQRRAGMSSSTQRRTHSVLTKMLKAAQAEGYPVAARVLATKAPEKAASDRTDVPVADAVRMLEKAAADPAGARWVAAFLQGLRQGEALGLTREAIDLDAGTLTISWQLQPLPYNVTRTAGVLRPPARHLPRDDRHPRRRDPTVLQRPEPQRPTLQRMSASGGSSQKGSVMTESPDILAHGRWVFDPRRRVVIWQPGAGDPPPRSSGRACRDCGGLRRRGRWYCDDCREHRRKESVRRYEQGKRSRGAA